MRRGSAASWKGGKEPYMLVEMKKEGKAPFTKVGKTKSLSSLAKLRRSSVRGKEAG